MIGLTLTPWVAMMLVLGGAILSAVATQPLIAWLSARQFGKVIREDGPEHAAKAGTPTMGGLAMVAIPALALAPLLWGRHEVLAWPALLLALLGFGALGAIDDWQGLARKGMARELGVGLRARHMFTLQIGMALLVAWLLRGVAPTWAAGSPADPMWAPWSVWAPTSVIAQYGLPLWLGLATLVLVATVNGVNLSDGLDGLAAGLIALTFAGLAAVLYLNMGRSPDATGVTGWALLAVGTCLGFLFHNRHPASVFMGNVSSMAMGGAIATLALATGLWPLLPIIGAVFVIEILSDVIQVGYYKYSGGKRVFRMAPIHHHFEMIGWPETRVVRRFWLAGLAAAIAGVGLSLLGSG